jgi:hypothetical protein
LQGGKKKHPKTIKNLRSCLLTQLEKKEKRKRRREKKTE